MAQPGPSHTSGTPPADGSGWGGLFWIAFRRSRNAMALLDEQRRYVDVNGAYLQLLECPRDALIGRAAWESVVDGPVMSGAEWRETLRGSHSTGVAELRSAGGSVVPIEAAVHPAVVTGRRLVLLVVLRVGPRRRSRGIGDAAPPTGTLSAREAEVVGLLALGLSGPEIAAELSVSHNTVRAHVANAMKKLGARTRAQLVAISLAGRGAGPPGGPK
jgi:DNA-binding CsgD family transcriptional regulator